MPGDIPFIVDAAFYTPESLKELNHVKWLTRIPSNYKEVQYWREQEDKSLTWVEIDKHNKIYSFKIKHEGIEQRWTLVDSEKSREKGKKTFLKKLDKIYDKESKALWHIGTQLYSCKEDAESAMKKLGFRQRYHKIEYEIMAEMRYPGKGRPKKETEQECIGYRCKARLSSDLSAIRKEIECLGRFVVGINELDEAILPAEEMLKQYKSQTHVERGFRFLKADEIELNHIFLKNPNRIGALMMLMTLCLVVYNFAQYRLRKTLEENEVMIPNQLGKPIQDPTLRWIYQLMSVISVLCLWDEPNQRWVKKICNLKKIHKIILYYYGSLALELYGISQMGPPEYDKTRKPLMDWCKM